MAGVQFQSNMMPLCVSLIIVLSNDSTTAQQSLLYSSVQVLIDEKWIRVCVTFNEHWPVIPLVIW